MRASFDLWFLSGSALASSVLVRKSSSSVSNQSTRRLILHVPVSLLAFTILFTFYLDQSCAPCTTMHRKNTEVLPQFFSCSYSQLYPCTRPLTSDRRSQVSIWTRVSLLATWHCLDTHDLASELIPIFPWSLILLEIAGLACVRTIAQCQGTGLLRV